MLEPGDRLLGGQAFVVAGDTRRRVAGELPSFEPGAVTHEREAAAIRLLDEPDDHRLVLLDRNPRRLLDADATFPVEHL